MRAVFNAVEADEALALSEILVWVGCSFAALQAEVAIGTAHRVAVNSPEREATENAEQSPQRANHATEKARNPPVGDQESHENQADDPGLPVFARLGVNAFGGLVDRGKNARCQRSDGQGNRVEKTDLERAVLLLVFLGRLGDSGLERREEPRRARLGQVLVAIGGDDLVRGVERGWNDPKARHRDHRGEDVILDGVESSVTVDLDELLGRLGPTDVAENVVKDAERAHPVAPNASQHHRHGDDHQAPDEVAVDGVRGQSGRNRDQRGGFEEERDRPALQVSKVGDEQKEKKEAKEKALVGASDLNQRSLRLGRPFGL